MLEFESASISDRIGCSLRNTVIRRLSEHLEVGAQLVQPTELCGRGLTCFCVLYSGARSSESARRIFACSQKVLSVFSRVAA